jgi:small subunit ribosomal protein S4
MSRYRGPRLRIVRRLGELPGFTQKISKKQTPPGQHGGARKKKLSQYGLRLQEKQKLRFNYGVTESQLIKYVRQARNLKGSTGEMVLQQLEMRLDATLFQLGMAPTIAAARQFISHGHILLNGKKVTIPSYQCLPKDVIAVSQKKQSHEMIKQMLDLNANTSKILPPHLSFQREELSGTVLKNIDRQWVALKLNELLIVEFYSRKV